MAGRPAKTPITSLMGLPDDQHISLSDVAAVLNIHKSTAYDLVVGGAMPFIRVTASAIRVEVRALRAYIDSRRVAARVAPLDRIRRAK